MTDNGKPPKLGDELRKWVFRRFGVPGLVVLALLTALSSVHSNWDKVKTWPGIPSSKAAYAAGIVLIVLNNMVFCQSTMVGIKGNFLIFLKGRLGESMEALIILLNPQRGHHGITAKRRRGSSAQDQGNL